MRRALGISNNLPETRLGTHVVDAVDWRANVVTCSCGYRCTAIDERRPTESPEFGRHVREAYRAAGRRRHA